MMYAGWDFIFVTKKEICISDLSRESLPASGSKEAGEYAELPWQKTGRWSFRM